MQWGKPWQWRQEEAKWGKVKACQAGLTSSHAAQIPKDVHTLCTLSESDRRARTCLRCFWPSPRRAHAMGWVFRGRTMMSWHKGLLLGRATQWGLRKEPKPVPLCAIIFYCIISLYHRGCFFWGRPCYFMLYELRGERSVLCWKLPLTQDWKSK